MEFSAASIQVQFHVQKFIRPPFLIKMKNENESTHSISTSLVPNILAVPNPLYRNMKKIFTNSVHSCQMYWIVTKLMIFMIWFESLGRISWLKANWSRLRDFEQLGYHALLCAIATIALSAYQAIDRHIPEICFLIAQLLQTVNQYAHRTLENLHSKSKAKQLD